VSQRPESQPVALVTGSAGGLGFAAAARLRDEGFRVHVVWRSSEARVPELEQGFAGRVHRADLCEVGAAVRLVEAVLAIDGELQHIVHAVGDYAEGSLAETESDTFRALFESNLFSARDLAEAARAPLRRAAESGADASMLFFGTAGLAGLGARVKTAAYGAAKSALLVLVRSLAKEEAPHGVRVNMISPGIVPHDGAHASTLDEDLQARIPLGRAGTPEEIAEGVHFLTTARQVTGQDLGIDGGWLL
jgi:NAD(P)-dependent dehydrogenase (short-subunit alcohol dehydrogenase family)